MATDSDTLPWGTVPELLDDAAERFGDGEALVEAGADAEVRMTFAELGAAAREASKAFLAAGIERGDRIAVWAPNIHEWVVALLGAQTAGAVVVPLDTRCKGEEAGAAIERSGTRILFTVTSFSDTDHVALLRSVSPELFGLSEVVVLRGDAPEGTITWRDFLARGEEATDVDVDRRAASVRPAHPCDILFTSLATGSPKGAVSTHAQALRAYAAWSDAVGLAEGDRQLVVNPLFHAWGYKAGILASLMRGAAIVPHAALDPAGVLATIEEERISVLPGPRALFRDLLDAPGLPRGEGSPLRVAVTGAASAPADLVARLREELGFERVIAGYGPAEASGVVTMCRHDDDPGTAAATAGRAIPDVEVRVVDREGRGVAAGEPGEVVVRGYNVTSGYLDDPEGTAEAVDGDGWLHTGDVGVMDERGYLRITDPDGTA